jgi:hypothetical protein
VFQLETGGGSPICKVQWLRSSFVMRVGAHS